MILQRNYVETQTQSICLNFATNLSKLLIDESNLLSISQIDFLEALQTEYNNTSEHLRKSTLYNPLRFFLSPGFMNNILNQIALVEEHGVEELQRFQRELDIIARINNLSNNTPAKDYKRVNTISGQGYYQIFLREMMQFRKEQESLPPSDRHLDAKTLLDTLLSNHRQR